jgi:hypothetical protein
MEFKRVEDPEEFLTALASRKVATVSDQRATPLPGFTFRPTTKLGHK